MKNISNEIINKLKCSCCALINELLIMKNYEDSNGNTNKYNWLHISDTPEPDSDYDSDDPDDDNLKPTLKVIDTMSGIKCDEIDKIIDVSDYFVFEDIDMLTMFMDNCCMQGWGTVRKNGTYWFDPKSNGTNVLSSTMFFQEAMFYYMELDPKFVKNILLSDQATIQLK